MTSKGNGESAAAQMGRIMGEAMAKPRPVPTRVYLAGCKGNWRAAARRVLGEPRFKLVDPFEDSRQDSIAQFVEDDLRHVGNCGLVIAYHAYHVFDGLALECGYAHARGIPIVYVCRQPRASSMIAGVSKAVFTELDAALGHVLERYGGEV